MVLFEYKVGRSLRLNAVGTCFVLRCKDTTKVSNKKIYFIVFY